VARVGLQLYTLRGECDRDLEGTLGRVGRQGYDGVELFQLHGHEPARVRQWLDESGLVTAGRHASLELLENELPQLHDELSALGTDRVAVSWVDPAWLAEPDHILERIQVVARRAQDIGLRLGVHNHESELQPLPGGSTFLDLVRRLSSELIWLELDLGWVWYAGADPLDQLELSAGRCPLVHVKDYSSREGRDDVPVGEGLVGYDRVVPAAVAAGAQWLVVEQDEPKGDPFAAVEQSLSAVRRFLASA
jgi:sugar phosphate isomerase/epimerase